MWLASLPVSVLPSPDVALSWEELPHLLRGGVRLVALVAALALALGWFWRAASVVVACGLGWLASHGRIDGLLAGQVALLCLALAAHPGGGVLRVFGAFEPVAATGERARYWTVASWFAGGAAALWALLGLFDSFGTGRFFGVVLALGWWALAALDERWLEPVDDTDSVVYFDGVCHFCQASVQFILEEEQRPRLRFAPLQGTTAQERIGQVAQRPHGSIVFTHGHEVFVGSDAALRTARAMGGFWRLFFALRWLPRRLRDAVYDWFAANRYRWFGKLEACFVPSPEVRSRFLE